MHQNFYLSVLAVFACFLKYAQSRTGRQVESVLFSSGFMLALLISWTSQAGLAASFKWANHSALDLLQALIFSQDNPIKVSTLKHRMYTWLSYLPETHRLFWCQASHHIMGYQWTEPQNVSVVLERLIHSDSYSERTGRAAVSIQLSS